VFDETALLFIARPLIARLSTLGADGYPHTIPVWYDVEGRGDGTEIVFVSDRSARKTRNLQRDPKAAVMIGGDPADGDGYLVRGDVTIADDAEHVVTHRMIDRYESGPRNDELRAAWKNDDIVVLRMRPRSVVRILV
jgi:PPOX class probable F420-dependent enzyme